MSPLEIELNSTDCVYCIKPLVWINRTKKLVNGSEVYEFDFRRDPCKGEYQFRDGKLNEKPIANDSY